eukprot:tig00021680_g23029.t1
MSSLIFIYKSDAAEPEPEPFPVSERQPEPVPDRYRERQPVAFAVSFEFAISESDCKLCSDSEPTAVAVAVVTREPEPVTSAKLKPEPDPVSSCCGRRKPIPFAEARGTGASSINGVAISLNSDGVATFEKPVVQTPQDGGDVIIYAENLPVGKTILIMIVSGTVQCPARNPRIHSPTEIRFTVPKFSANCGQSSGRNLLQASAAFVPGAAYDLKISSPDGAFADLTLAKAFAWIPTGTSASSVPFVSSGHNTNPSLLLIVLSAMATAAFLFMGHGSCNRM